MHSEKCSQSRDGKYWWKGCKLNDELVVRLQDCTVHYGGLTPARYASIIFWCIVLFSNAGSFFDISYFQLTF